MFIEGDYSFFNFDGTLISNKQVIEGKIHVETEDRSAA
jgi:hypothetical protein